MPAQHHICGFKAPGFLGILKGSQAESPHCIQTSRLVICCKGRQIGWERLSNMKWKLGADNYLLSIVSIGFGPYLLALGKE